MGITTAESLIDDYAYGNLTFPELVEKFSQLAMTLPLSIRDPARTFGESYRRAEEGDSSDIPGALSAAAFAHQITEAQREQLYAIYCERFPE